MAGPVVHTYRAAESGLDVNSYLIEGESGVAVVDTSLLASDIEALRARLRALRKPLLAILVTHAHPDHFNGVLGLVQDREVPVYATAGVGRVQLDELSFTVREVGPAESHADSYLLLAVPGSATIAFSGDLAFHGTHPYTADGHSGAWLAALDALGGELAGIGTLYPGHGGPADLGLLADQRRYLMYYRELIRRLSGGEPRLSEAAKSELSAALQAFLPDAPLAWMIELGADAVAAELAAADTATSTR
jgi:glyoxylase-like metal-dependent hydrolase (beta-lactamase superfamily II)